MYGNENLMYKTVGIGYFIIIALLLLINFIGLWKTFNKAGVSGLWAIIPIANIYMTAKIAKVNPLIIFGYLLGIIPFIGPFISMGISIYISYNFVKNYGFGIGGYLLYLLFTPIMVIYMGFSDNVQYQVNLSK